MISHASPLHSATPFNPFDAAQIAGSMLDDARIRQSVVAGGEWLLEAARAAGGKGVGYRDIIFYRDGTHRWLYPHANMGEQIETHLQLWELTSEERFLNGAIDYAEKMLADPEKGIYQGAERDAVGLSYYWRDVGSYTGMYSMRAVAPLDRLASLTGESKYRDAARFIAEPLLREFNAIGLPVHFAWMPGEEFFLKEPSAKVGSRIGYLVGFYAYCEAVLKDDRAREGREALNAALARIQNADGSFPQTFCCDGSPGDRSIKNHFFGYILNGLATNLELFPDDCVAMQTAVKLADFAKGQLDYFGMIPYCGSADNPNITDQAALFFPVIDPAPALIKLSRLLNRPDYLRCAEQIWLGQWARQVNAPDRPEAHGSIPTTVDPLVTASPELSKYGGGIPHLEENPNRIACSGTYFVNQFIQAGILLLQTPQHTAAVL